LSLTQVSFQKFLFLFLFFFASLDCFLMLDSCAFFNRHSIIFFFCQFSSIHFVLVRDVSSIMVFGLHFLCVLKENNWGTLF
jgi:hypothetical protein